MKRVFKDGFCKQRNDNSEVEPTSEVTASYIRLFKNYYSRMKSGMFFLLLSMALVSFEGVSGKTWYTDFNKAKAVAEKSHNYILLSFSGSDWCVPCIKMHKDIFESAPFENYSDKQLVLVKADFPRLHKNRLSKEQQKENDALAEMYNPGGRFPYTVLMNENGKIVKSWEGYSKESPEKFVSEISAVMHENK